MRSCMKCDHHLKVTKSVLFSIRKMYIIVIDRDQSFFRYILKIDMYFRDDTAGRNRCLQRLERDGNNKWSCYKINYNASRKS